jgi:ribosomal protein S27E
MAADRPHPGHPVSRLINVTCPNCRSPQAVVAAANFGEFLCFCPACEHVWDCDAALVDKPRR